MSKLLVLALLTSVFASYSAHALPLPKPGQNQHNYSLPFSLTANYNFEGIVALDNCSGSLVQLEGAPDTDLALVFTNGHCLEGGFTPAGQVVSHQRSSRRFNIMNPDTSTAVSLRATEIVYSSMTKTDLTIYKLGVTYAEIKAKHNVRPLVLASTRPTETTPIEIISGYWKRGYSCAIESFIPQLREDQWTWVDSVRYSRPGCETIGGTSGSPVIQAGTRRMIAINNTGNESGGRCTMNNPCEVDAQGNITWTEGVSYAQQTYWVYSCLNANREIDLTVPGCQLHH